MSFSVASHEANLSVSETCCLSLLHSCSCSPKRAGYLTANPKADESEEVIYADDRLWKKEDAVIREKSANSARKHSFYRVDLGGLVEAGLGVTSDTAKFWISSETAVETTRDYGLLILKKFTSTVNRTEARERGDFILQAGAFDYDTFMTLADYANLREKPKSSNRMQSKALNGGAGEIRTPDTWFRKPMLYPSELQPHYEQTTTFSAR